MSKEKPNYNISLSFELISLPPFRDILLLGRKCPHGKTGMTKCLDLLAPDNFEVYDVDDGNVEAILVSNRLVKLIPISKIIEVLREKVFPYVTNCDLIKVDFGVRVSYQEFPIKIED